MVWKEARKAQEKKSKEKTFFWQTWTKKKIFLSKIGALDDVFWTEITRMCVKKTKKRKW